jgi:multicomponent K+:H+ antiporter subunit G
VNVLVEILISLLLLLGTGFSLIGSVGLARLPDFFSRLHGPAKTVTLGIGGTLLASMLYFSARDPGVSVHGLLIAVFLFITTPVSAHLMAKAGLHLGVQTVGAGAEGGSSNKNS